MRRSTSLRLAVLLLAAGGCSDEPAREPREPVPEPPVPDEAIAALEGHSFERSLLLVGFPDDTLVAVFWRVGARAGAEGVDRDVQGFVLRDAEWETVLDDTWTDPPTRVPWRLLPREDLRLLVGPDDALETLLYEGGTGTVELVPGGVLTEWTGPRGGTYVLLEGSGRVDERSVEGLLLDVGRSTAPGEPAYGDWAFLVSGDSLQAVLHSPLRDAPAEGGWRGWARLDFRRLAWPVVTATWSAVRAFEPARREVPVGWVFTSPREEVAGELEAESVWMEAGEGDGPRLPVSGLFGVRGSLTVEGRVYPVSGVFRHTQR